MNNTLLINKLFKFSWCSHCQHIPGQAASRSAGQGWSLQIQREEARGWPGGCPQGDPTEAGAAPWNVTGIPGSPVLLKQINANPLPSPSCQDKRDQDCTEIKSSALIWSVDASRDASPSPSASAFPCGEAILLLSQHKHKPQTPWWDSVLKYFL